MFQYGMRPILMAAWHGHTDAVQMLINYGASVNTINKVSFNNNILKLKIDNLLYILFYFYFIRFYGI